MDVGLISLIYKRSVLGLIRFTGKVSRSEISKLSGLTSPTVNRIIKDLIIFNLRLRLLKSSFLHVNY